MGSLLPVTTGIQVALPPSRPAVQRRRAACVAPRTRIHGRSARDPRRRSRAAASREMPVAEVPLARGTSCPPGPAPLTRERPGQLLFVFIFMVVETSGSAGGTSGVAGSERWRPRVRGRAGPPA